MKHNIKLTIIVPIYNGENYLNELLESMEPQLIEAVEIILINDGSTDRTLEMCNNFAEKCDNVTVIDKNNEGVSAARNAGLNIARGKWITFADHDDWFGSDAFQILLNAVDEADTDMIIHEPVLEFGNDLKILHFPVSSGVYEGNEMFEKVIVPMCFGTMNKGSYGFSLCFWNCIFKNELIKKYHLKLDTYLRMAEDHVFISQYMGICKSVELLGKSVYYWRANQSSATHTHKPISRQLAVQKSIYICDKIEEGLKNYPKDKWEKYMYPKYANIVIGAGRNLIGEKMTIFKKRNELISVLNQPIISNAIKRADLSVCAAFRNKIELGLVKTKSAVLVLLYCYIIMKLKKLRK